MLITFEGGLLVELMKRATQNKQYAEIDHAIKTKVFEIYVKPTTFNIIYFIYRM